MARPDCFVKIAWVDLHGHRPTDREGRKIPVRFGVLFLVGGILLGWGLAACGGESVASPTPVAPAVTVVLPVQPETSTPADGGDAAQPPSSLLTRPGGSIGFSRYFLEELGGEVVATLVEGPRGEQVRSSQSYLGLKQLYDSGEPPPEELRMSREELGRLVGQLDTVREATEKYQDVEVAFADGYLLSATEVPNMGHTSPTPAD